MRIGGFQKVSLIDYPGRVAAVVFAQGCNFRCPFCHNPELVLPSCFRDCLDSGEILRFLAARMGKLQGVVVTGGEPSLQKELPEFLAQLKAMGYAVKLDTNGSRPAVLKNLISRGLVDFIAMDIKGPLERYAQITGVPVDTSLIQESIAVILESGIGHVFRTTFPKPFLGREDIPAIVALIQDSGRFRLQPFVPQQQILDPSILDQAHYGDHEFGMLCRVCETALAQRGLTSCPSEAEFSG